MLRAPVTIAMAVAVVLFPISASFAGQRIETKDTNKDGTPDEWVTYEGETPVRIERDLDGDGRREVVILLEAGKPVRSEVDRNGDGRPDFIRYFTKGRPVREQGDLNFDGKWDTWIFYRENGTKDLMIRDRNFDGKPDAWFYYDPAGVKMVGGKMDEDFNGKVRTFGAVPDEEKRTAW